MEPEAQDQLTQILRDVAGGDRSALDDLLSAVYNDLRALSARHMEGERANHTLQPTALVHEVWMRLIDQRSVQWRDRAHFLSLASQLMRRILVDHARGRHSAKSGGDLHKLTIQEADAVVDAQEVDLVALDEALAKLADINPVQTRLVEMKFFGGMTIDEIAAVLGMGKRSVDREWACAKAWLFRELTA
ncbi:MAG: sigma-70 family RNA polymerase sigma factor [Planctomycetota bacterium]|jgi:RNA polymerase sigma factor (TIGR02999 family)